jgi:tetratricopeptide (TPR) repeat protein
MLAGQPAAAESALRRDYDVLASLNETYFRSTVAALLGNALWALGRFDEAASYAEISKEIAGDDDVLSQVLWRTVRAKHLANKGSAEDAIALATEAVQLAAETVDIELQADALSELAEVLHLAGRGHERGPHLREALALYELKGDVVLGGALRARLAVPVTS